MLRDYVVVVVVVRTRPQAISLAMMTMRKSTHGFPFISYTWDAYGAPLGGPSGHRSSAIIFAPIGGYCLFIKFSTLDNAILAF